MRQDGKTVMYVARDKVLAGYCPGGYAEPGDMAAVAAVKRMVLT
jgi:hypothetical protein